MAQYQLNHPDDLIACPYNPSHLVKARRFPYHLIKCRKNNPHMDYAVCPFNARHEMPYAELRYHIARCIDRTVLEQDIAHAHASRDGSKTKGNTSVPAYDDDSYDGAQTDDWDCEAAPYSNSLDENSTANAMPINCDEESDRLKRPSQIGPSDIHNDMPTTRPPRGLPAVLQMAQQLRLSDIAEKRDDKVEQSVEKNECPVPVTMETPACDNQRRKIHEQSLQTFAIGRGMGRGIPAVPPVGTQEYSCPVSRERYCDERWEGSDVYLPVSPDASCESRSFFIVASARGHLVFVQSINLAIPCVSNCSYIMRI